jgi:Zn-dependent peptidase ImmA (M78 family)
VGHHYGPREQFTCGHELGHHYEPPGLRPEAVESWCDRFSAALLMPERPFLAACGESLFDLGALRRRVQWASWQALARRIVDLCPDTAAAWWSGSMMVERASSSGTPMSEAERMAFREARKGRVARVEAGGVFARGWSVPRGRQAWVVTLAIPSQV